MIRDLFWIVFVLNAVLWLALLFLPPVIIFRRKVSYFSGNPVAISVLNIVIAEKKAFSEEILRHELKHLQQQKIFTPVGFALIILATTFWLFIKYRNPALMYKHSWIEKQANLAMGDKRRELPRLWVIDWS